MLGTLIASHALWTLQGAGELRALHSVLAEISRKADVYAVAIQGLAGEKVVAPRIDQIGRENVEEVLLAIVAKLAVPSRIVRLNLPRGRNWTAEELLAYGRAEADLFRRKVGELTRDGSIEVLGETVSKDKSGPVVDALKLRPVYVVVMSRANFGGTWETTYGTMQLTQKGSKVTGGYSTNGGQIMGDVMDNKLQFVWQETNGSSGFGTFTLSEDGSKFSGPWFSNSDPRTPSGTWTGTRSPSE